MAVKPISDSQPETNQAEGVQDLDQNPVKTYTQADIDSIVGKVRYAERDKLMKNIEAEKAKAVEEWRLENGLSDEALASVSKKDEYQIELKKRDHSIQKYEQEFQVLKQELSKKEQALHSYLAKSSVQKYAIENNSCDPETVFLWLKDDILIDDNGNTIMKDGDSVENAVKGLLKRKPNLVKSSVEFGGGGFKGGSGESANKADYKTIEGRQKRLRELLYK